MNDDDLRRLGKQAAIYRPLLEQAMATYNAQANEIGQRAADVIDAQFREIGKVVTAYNAQVDQQLEQMQATVRSALQIDWSALGQLTDLANQMLRGTYPPNWPDDIDLDFPKLEGIVQEEGIAIFYVPRGAIVAELMEAPDFEARLKIVGDRSDEIAEDCRDALKEPVHELIEDRAILVRQAVNAFIDGHHEAAQALAVVVCDSYLKTHFDGLGYTKMREKLTLDQSDDEALWTVFRYDMPMATAVRFLVDWKSHKHPVPSNFSRHVTIHGASTAQLNSFHATLAIMLAATMTRALDAILEPGGNAPETVASGGK